MSNFQNMFNRLILRLIFQLGEQLIIYMFNYFVVNSFIFLDFNLYINNTESIKDGNLKVNSSLSQICKMWTEEYFEFQRHTSMHVCDSQLY